VAWITNATQPARVAVLNDAMVRNPIHTFQSYVRRFAHRWPESIFVPFIVQCYDLWHDLYERLNAHSFLVDAEDQVEEIARLARFLNVPAYTYKAQGRTMNSAGTDIPEHARDFHDNPPDEILSLAETFGYEPSIGEAQCIT